MKALLIILAALFALAHPAAAAVVLAAGLAVCGAAGWLAWRAAHPLRSCRCPHRRFA